MKSKELDKCKILDLKNGNFLLDKGRYHITIGNVIYYMVISYGGKEVSKKDLQFIHGSNGAVLYRGE